MMYVCVSVCLFGVCVCRCVVGVGGGGDICFLWKLFLLIFIFLHENLYCGYSLEVPLLMSTHKCF